MLELQRRLLAAFGDDPSFASMRRAIADARAYELAFVESLKRQAEAIAREMEADLRLVDPHATVRVVGGDVVRLADGKIDLP